MFAPRRGLVACLRNDRRVLATLVDAKPLAWEDSIEHLAYVREHGIKQFLNTWNRVKDLQVQFLCSHTFLILCFWM